MFSMLAMLLDAGAYSVARACSIQPRGDQAVCSRQPQSSVVCTSR